MRNFGQDVERKWDYRQSDNLAGRDTIDPQ
jgi:hypothetical protein